MNKNKIITCSLLISILTLNSTALAFPFHKKTLIKSQVNEYKFKDINLDWWKSYNDEHLESYIIKAIEENKDLKIATLKVEQAMQNMKLQFANELPHAGIGAIPGSYKPMGSTNADGIFALPMVVNYEADIFLKNRNKTQSAKKSYEISQLNEKTAYIIVASQVGTIYFNIVKIDKLIKLQEDIISTRKQVYELMNERNKLGLTSTADLVRANKDYINSKVDMSDFKKARIIMLNSLAVLTGTSPDNIEEFKRVSYDDFLYNINIPKEIPSEIITQRPDYIAAEKQVEKCKIDVKVAKKEFLPNINILGLLSFVSSSANSSFSWTNALSAVGGIASMSVFSGGAKTAKLKLKKNLYEQVLENYYKTNLIAIQEVNDALSSLKQDNQKYENNLKFLKMQEEDFNYTKIRNEGGLISNLDLLQQKENLLVANKTIVQSKTDCLINQISLYKALGGKRL